MRKIISLMMVLAMLVSAMAVSTFTASAEMGDYDIDYVEAYYFTAAPTIDGYITTEEWGEVTVEMQSDWCASKDDTAPYYNSFFYWKNGGMSDNTMKASIWLRWDENYYYVGVKVRDYDGHSLRHGKTETWNGDAIQFKVDKDGPNSASYGEAYDPSIGTPWFDSTIPDFIAGYVQVAGGFVECYDNTNNKGLTAYSSPVFGAVKIAVAPSEQNAENPAGYHSDAADGYTTYEIAIPWKYIFENHKVPSYSSLTAAEKEAYTLKYAEYDQRKEPNGGIGYCLGMSLTIFNAAKGESTWNAFMSWGSGTTNVQTDEAHQTAAGSNCVTLSDVQVTPGSYAKYDPSVLESDRTTKTYDTVFYDYLANDFTGANPLTSADALTVLTYTDDTDMDYWGGTNVTFQATTTDVGGEHGKVLNFDRMLETKTEEDGTVLVAGVDAIDTFYIDTGVDEDLAYTYPLSYTLEFDIMYTGNEIVQNGRASELGNWFGGADAVSYYCGYSFNDKAFIINDVTDPNTWLASKSYDLQPNTWYNWKFQYDNDTCTARLLINDEVIFNVYNRYFYYSSEQHQTEGTLLVYWFINTQIKMDNVKMYNFYDYVHKTADEIEDNAGGNSTGNNGNAGNSGTAGTITQTQTGGEKIDVSIDVKEDGTSSVKIPGKAEYKTLTSLSYTVTLNTDNFEFVGIEGLEESDYTLEDKGDGSYIITIKNLDKFKAAAVGETIFEVIVKCKLDEATADQIKELIVKDPAEGGVSVVDSYSFIETVQTGDSMIYVAIIAAVVLAGCAVVVYNKKRSF